MVELKAADLAVIKVAPLGGVRRALNVAQKLPIPVVVSSALDTSVGLAAGVTLAAALPDLPFACGLDTGTLLGADVVGSRLRSENGVLSLGRARKVLGSLSLVHSDVSSADRKVLRDSGWIERVEEMVEHLG